MRVKQVRIDAAIDVFFCDPHAPWQRGSNEITNGPLRQYFPKGTNFATVTAAELDAVADELRPTTQTLRLRDTTEQIAELCRNNRRIRRPRRRHISS